METLDNTLSVSAEGIAAINTIIPIIHAADFRESFPLAVIAATIISYKLNEDVNVAKNSKIKNKAKKNDPNGISPNAAGKTINNNPGPSVGSNPNAKTTGKIAKPAKKEVKIFNPTTDPADDVKLTSRFKYELYVTIHENPTESEKNDCPKAKRTDSPVMLEKSGAKKKTTPSMAPSNVNARTTNTMKKINNKGIIILFARSIPFATPSAMTITFISVKISRPISVVVGLEIIEPNLAA